MNSDSAQQSGNGTSGHVPAPLRQVLRVRIQDTQCAIDLAQVERVLPLVELQQVPGGPPHLAGLMNYRGESLAVVDLGIWLGMQDAQPYSLDTPIVLCREAGLRVAFVVSEAMQIEAAESAAVQMQAAFEQGEAAFTASLNLTSGLALLLDMRRIMTHNFAAAGARIPAGAYSPSAEPAA